MVVAWLVSRRRRRKIRAPSPVPDGPRDEPYRAYTERHDLIHHASEGPATLSSSSPDSEKGWLVGEQGWEEAVGRADSFRLERGAVFASLGDRAGGTFEQSGVSAQQVAVCLLIDQSGSMKDEPMAATAASVAWLAGVLAKWGAKAEILGFSTAGWHGGFPYQEWQRSGRPKRPGRLCALRHVIYKSADEAFTDLAKRMLVHPDLLRENVDGEALQWAAARLETRPEPIRLLIMVSDGAPVDDATLLHNGENYLRRHLVSCIREIQHRDDLLLGAVGVSCCVQQFYSLSTAATELADMPAALVDLLEKMIVASRDRPRPLAGPPTA